MPSNAHSKFHFSPRPNRAGEIRWEEWGDDAFRKARETGKPILLALSAVWCHWCHVMDETSYSDEGVISYINEHYVPVRVDNDQRPDINARYNLGGWPTTAFLTPDGEVLTGGTYIPPDQMKDLLPKVNVYYRSNKGEVEQKVADARIRRAAAQGEASRGELSPAVFDVILQNISTNYDPVFGGFGEAPKFPHTDANDLLLYAHRKTRDPDLLHMARKTLEFMANGEVFDQEWGGFFRYATRRDWSEPHYEKMLEDNANLLRNVLALHRMTGAEGHADVARRTIDYLNWKLRDGERGYFYGSQDADEQFYKLSREGRQQQAEPYIDRTCYTSWNAMAVSAYLEASWTLDRPDLRDAALKTLDFLWEGLRDAESGSMYRYLPAGPEAQPQILGLLGDQAHTARALLDAAEVTGYSAYIDRALELARLLVHRFLDRIDARPAGFFDVWDEVPEQGRLGDRQKSVQDNAVCAEVFLRLGHLLRDEGDIEIAQGTLEAFVSSVPHLGYFAAGYARQVDAFLNRPPEINIVGSPSAAAGLVRAALLLDTPSRIVQLLDPQRDTERLEALALPSAAPVAYVCAGTACSPPVTEPGGLKEAVEALQTAGVRTIGR
ncbi:MAG: thioredoxin domain-containing protein [Chloroflexi bacterium]|nr:MAG: thioredoxin domain-containing protein [Chloroflexota bacterium]